MVQSQPTGGIRLSLRELYIQHWLHVRHLENERLNLTSLYALLVGGGVIFLFGQNLSKIVQVWLLIFLLIVTVAIGLIVYRLGNRLKEYRINVDEKIAKAAGLASYLVSRPMRGGGPFRTHYLLAVVYLGAFIGLGVLLILSLLNVDLATKVVIN